jgi:hypothetical protein
MITIRNFGSLEHFTAPVAMVVASMRRLAAVDRVRVLHTRKWRMFAATFARLLLAEGRNMV